MESGVMVSERELMRKISIDWLNQLNGIATPPMHPL
jgi:hypothetical protein